MKKRILTVICFAFVVACLTGCGGQKKAVAKAPYFTEGVYVNYAAEAENPPHGLLLCFL